MMAVVTTEMPAIEIAVHIKYRLTPMVLGMIVIQPTTAEIVVVPITKHQPIVGVLGKNTQVTSPHTITQQRAHIMAVLTIGQSVLPVVYIELQVIPMVQHIQE
jgi:hypothetical protein